MNNSNFKNVVTDITNKVIRSLNLTITQADQLTQTVNSNYSTIQSVVQQRLQGQTPFLDKVSGIIQECILELAKRLGIYAPATNLTQQPTFGNIVNLQGTNNNTFIPTDKDSSFIGNLGIVNPYAEGNNKISNITNTNPINNNLLTSQAELFKQELNKRNEEVDNTQNIQNYTSSKKDGIKAFILKAEKIKSFDMGTGYRVSNCNRTKFNDNVCQGDEAITGSIVSYKETDVEKIGEKIEQTILEHNKEEIDYAFEIMFPEKQYIKLDAKVLELVKKIATKTHKKSDGFITFRNGLDPIFEKYPILDKVIMQLINRQLQEEIFFPANIGRLGVDTREVANAIMGVPPKSVPIELEMYNNPNFCEALEALGKSVLYQLSLLSIEKFTNKEQAINDPIEYEMNKDFNILSIPQYAIYTNLSSKKLIGVFNSSGEAEGAIPKNVMNEFMPLVVLTHKYINYDLYMNKDGCYLISGVFVNYADDCYIRLERSKALLDL